MSGMMLHMFVSTALAQCSTTLVIKSGIYLLTSQYLIVLSWQALRRVPCTGPSPYTRNCTDSTLLSCPLNSPSLSRVSALHSVIRAPQLVAKYPWHKETYHIGFWWFVTCIYIQYNYQLVELTLFQCRLISGSLPATTTLRHCPVSTSHWQILYEHK